jgi:hypothetical protein
MSLILSGSDGLSDIDGSASTPAIRGTDANTGIFFPAADTIAFSEGGAEAMRIDSSGNVGIGTDSPEGKLHVLGGSAGTVTAPSNFPLVLEGTTIAGISFLTSNTGEARLWFGDPDDNDVGRIEYAHSTNAMTFRTNASDRMTIDSSGGLILVGSTAQKATGTTWSNPSDQRLKDNIRDYTKGTAELMQVRVREWEYNGKGGTVEGTKGLGVVADEVMVVLPDTVANYEAKLSADDEDVTAIKKFDATEITWLLVKTVQELKAELDTVKAQSAAFEARLAALEAK